MVRRFDTRPLHWPVLLVFTVLGVVSLPYLILVVPEPWGYDAWAYANVDLADPYGAFGNLNELGAFRYAPPAAFAFALLSAVPWPAALVVWTCILAGAVLALGGRRYSLAIAGIPFVARDLHFANVNLVLAASIAAAFRYPALWAVVLLTKPTCGVGLLWFAARREWRPLGIALAVTAAVALPTAVLRPDLWRDWIALLADNAGVAQWVPLAIRLPVAGLVALWGGRRGARWTVPLAATIALPHLWWNHLSLIVGVVPLLLADRATPPWIRTPRAVTGSGAA
ncbi:MAG: hypothetical protein RL338_357 [Chloroflexota bacterium]|jgi:hypothetical protein